MDDNKYVTRQEFEKLELKFEKLINTLESCDLRMKPSFESLTQEDDFDLFDDDLDLPENQEEESKVESNSNESDIEF